MTTEEGKQKVALPYKGRRAKEQRTDVNDLRERGNQKKEKCEGREWEEKKMEYWGRQNALLEKHIRCVQSCLKGW